MDQTPATHAPSAWILLLPLMAVFVCWMTPAGVRAQPPNARFSGTYEGDGLTLVLRQDKLEDSNVGELTIGGKTYPVRISTDEVKGTHGIFTVGQQQFPLSLTLRDDQLELTSEGATYRLRRKAAATEAAAAEAPRDGGPPPIPPNAPGGETPGAAAPRSVAPRGEVLKFVPLTIRDPGIYNWEAVSFLVPAGWQARGGIYWTPNNLPLANMDLTVADPNSVEAIRWLPIGNYCWQQGGMFGFPQGSNYMGMEMQPPPQDGATYVQHVVLPRHYRNVRPRIVGQQPLPKLAQVLHATRNNAEAQQLGLRSQVTAWRVRIEYAERGVPVEEDVYVTMIVTPNPYIQGSIMWETERVISYRARKGELDRRTPVLQVATSSAKLSLKWYAGYCEVMKLFQNRMNQGIQQARQLSDYVRGINEEISAMYRESYRQQQASQDRIHREFSEYIRGVETYRTDAGEVQLPGGYKQAWTNSLGEYILSNDPFFNPGQVSNQNWQELHPVD